MQEKLGLKAKLPVFKANDQNSSSFSDTDEENCSNKRRIKKKFYLPKTTRLKAALQYNEDCESVDDATLSLSQSDIKHLWNSVILEPDSENKVKIRNYFPSLVKSMQFSNEERFLNQKSDFVNSVEIEKRRRYPKRNCSRRNYNESKVSLNNDDYFFCDFCDLEYEDNCPEHPLLLLLNKQSPRDVKNKNRAKATTPWPLFIGNSSIKGAGLGVWTYAHLPQGLLFGPYEGRVNCDVKLGFESGYGWKIRNKTHPRKCIDAIDTTVSNWMRFVNCSRSDCEANLSAFQFKGEMYYKTITEIKRDEELLIWYGDKYGMKLAYSLVNTKYETALTFSDKVEAKEEEEAEEGVMPQTKLAMSESRSSKSRNFVERTSTIYGGPAFILFINKK